MVLPKQNYHQRGGSIMAQKDDFLLNSNFLGKEYWSYRGCLILNLLQIVMGLELTIRKDFVKIVVEAVVPVFERSAANENRDNTYVSL
jgi:hypothetical protein